MCEVSLKIKDWAAKCSVVVYMYSFDFIITFFSSYLDLRRLPENCSSSFFPITKTLILKVIYFITRRYQDLSDIFKRDMRHSYISDEGSCGDSPVSSERLLVNLSGSSMSSTENAVLCTSGTLTVCMSAVCACPLPLLGFIYSHWHKDAQKQKRDTLRVAAGPCGATSACKCRVLGGAWGGWSGLFIAVHLVEMCPFLFLRVALCAAACHYLQMCDVPPVVMVIDGVSHQRES